MFPLSKKRKVLKRRVSPQTTPDLDSHASMRTRFTDRSQHLYQKTQTPTVPTQLVSSMQEPFLREAEYCGQIHASRARTLKINRMRGKYTKSIKKSVRFRTERQTFPLPVGEILDENDVSLPPCPV